MHRFERAHPQHTVTPIDLSDAPIAKDVRRLLATWKEQGKKSDTDVATEFAAIEQCLRYSGHFCLQSFGLLAENRLPGSLCMNVGATVA